MLYLFFYKDRKNNDMKKSIFTIYLHFGVAYHIVYNITKNRLDEFEKQRHKI